MNQRTLYRVLYYIMARLYLVVQTGRVEAVWGLTQFRVYKLSNFSLFFAFGHFSLSRNMYP